MAPYLNVAPLAAEVPVSEVLHLLVAAPALGPDVGAGLVEGRYDHYQVLKLPTFNK